MTQHESKAMTSQEANCTVQIAQDKPPAPYIPDANEYD